MLVTAIWMFFGAGCCWRFRCKPPANGVTALPADIAQQFELSSSRETAAEAALPPKRDYQVWRFELAEVPNGHTTNRALVLECFVPAHVTNPPVILILPMLGGTYPLEKFFGKYFARHGLASVIVHREEIDDSKPISAEELNEMFRQTVLDNKRAIDWLETRSEFDASRLGVFGVSMGAIKGALLAPLEPRVDATVLALAGGDLPYILTYTSERGIAKRRREIMAGRQLTEQTLRAQLTEKMTCDPIRFAPYIDPHKVLLVLAAWDTTVPVKKGLELRKAMHKPETIVVASGHYTAAVYLPYLRREAMLFFKKRLSGKVPIWDTAERTHQFRNGR